MKKASLLVLAVTAISCSRILFSLFADPEGPNLLVVIATALVVFFLSWLVYHFSASIAGLKRLLLAVSTQFIIVVIIYFCLK